MPHTIRWCGRWLKQGFDRLSPNGLKLRTLAMDFPLALSLSKCDRFNLTHYPHHPRRLTATTAAALVRAMSDDSTNPNVLVARQLVDRLLAKDVDGVADLYTDDMTAWRNSDGRTLVRQQALKVVRILTGTLQDLRYENVRVTPTATGYVQQHTMRCTAPNGQPVEAHVCMIATLENGKIKHVAEYMDTAQMAPLMK
jgi:ketosteroid isomerase-like protein